MKTYSRHSGATYVAVEWMMMLPEYAWTHGSRTQRLKMLGNAVVPPHALYALELLA
jgi:site-specific DNA-cytosine methylase